MRRLAELASVSLLVLTVGCGSTAADDEDCGRFADEQPQAEFQVRFTNARTTTAFVGMQNGCGELEPISLQNAQGETQRLSIGDCGSGCERLQRGPAGCATICRIPDVVQIAPGGHHDFVWSGTTYVDAAMPAGCYLESQPAGATCAKSVIAPPGTYQVSGMLWPAADCSQVGGSCASCTPDASGSCELSGYVTGQSATKSVSLQVPVSASVELVFD